MFGSSTVKINNLNQSLSVWKQLLFCNYYCFHIEVPFEWQSHFHVHERSLNANRIVCKSAPAIKASINIRAANWLYTSEQSIIADDLSSDTFNKYDKLSSLCPLLLVDIDSFSLHRTFLHDKQSLS